MEQNQKSKKKVYCNGYQLFKTSEKIPIDTSLTSISPKRPKTTIVYENLKVLKKCDLQFKLRIGI